MRSHKSQTVVLRAARIAAAVLAVALPALLSAQMTGSGTSNFGTSGSNFGSSNFGSSGSSSRRSSSRSSTSSFDSGSSFGAGSEIDGSGSGSLRDRDRSRKSDRDSDRKRSSRKSKRDKDSDTTKPEPAAEGVPARAAPQAASGNKRGGRRGGGGGNSHMPETVALPTYAISSQINSDSLYFSPAEIEIPAGWRFSTPLTYYNAGSHGIERVDLWIKYAPELLDPVSINVEGLRTNGATNIKNEVYREWGYIRVRAEFESPIAQLLLPVATVHWRATNTPTTAFVTIQAPENAVGGIFDSNGDIIYNQQILNEGLVALRIRITEPPSEYEGDDPAFRYVVAGEDPVVPPSASRAGVRLGLLPKSKNLNADDVSTLDVVVINPAQVEFDRLRFRLRYNPDDIEVLDADEDNYISRDVNIYDGGFHDAMPFDLHTANRVDAASGTIEYSVGSQNGERAYPTGSVARVVFRVKRNSGAAFFWFEGTNPKTGERASDVTVRGRSVLGNPTESADQALHNVMLNFGHM